MRLRYRLLDVFTDKPFAGNQLAVFDGEVPIVEAMLQPIARELNLSETVFMVGGAAAGEPRPIRVFNGSSELRFAGHPTLGTAALIALDENVSRVELSLPQGVVPVEVDVTGSRTAFGWMNQPLPQTLAWTGNLDALLEVLGGTSVQVPVRCYDNGIAHLYLLFESVEAVRALAPNFSALRDVCGGARVSCLAGRGTNYTARMFTAFDPALFEDPACGSAAGPMAVFLVEHGRLANGEQLTISQGEFVGRPSTLYASAEFDGSELVRVRVGGSSVVIGEGALEVDLR